MADSYKREKGQMIKLTLQDISTIGSGMRRPECVLATKSGDLFCSDGRGGYDIVKSDGRTRFIKAIGAPDDFMPNGIALMPNRDILAANLADSSGVWRIRPDGQARLFLAEADGVVLPPVNFVGLDRVGRLWISVSTRAIPRHPSFRKGRGDGFIAVYDKVPHASSPTISPSPTKRWSIRPVPGSMSTKPSGNAPRAIPFASTHH